MIYAVAAMFEFSPKPGAAKPDLYHDLVRAGEALIDGETDGTANMANIAALIWQYIPDLNWAGFYRMNGNALILGPFIGKPACVRIALGEGVCGTAAASRKTQLIGDVHAFPGHIACDAASRAELVVPVIQNSVVIAVIDLDSPVAKRFDTLDAQGIEALAQSIAPFI